MSNILFITTVYRTGEKVYPIIPVLSKEHKIDILNMGQMSVNTPWPTKNDPRIKFYTMCKSLNLEIFNAPEFIDDKDLMSSVYASFIKNINSILKSSYYNIAIIDNNITQKGINLSMLYQWLNSQNIPVVGCPHGNREFDGYRVLKRKGTLFDYSFVFGEKEKSYILKSEKKYSQHSECLLPAGIPSNDIIKTYLLNGKYILIIPSFTSKQPKEAKTGSFSVFNKDLFYKMNFLGLSQKMGLPIVIKEKVKIFYNDISLEESLSGLSGVSFVRDCDDDNDLVCNARCVISAPSTMAFKSIQAGIPTVLLNGHGMIGNFFDYPGLIGETEEEMNQSLFRQMSESIKFTDFIKSTLSGGIDYTSVSIYVDYINKIIDRRI